MKIYCQQCGNELKNGILICPKCGFENKILGRGKRLYKIAFFFLGIIVVIGISFSYREVLFSYFEEITGENIGVTNTEDLDMDKKNDFKRAFDKYYYAHRVFFKSSGLMYINKNTEINGLFKQRDEQRSAFEQNDCSINNDNNCQEVKQQLEDLDNRIQETTQKINGISAQCISVRLTKKPVGINCDDYKYATLSWNSLNCEDCEREIKNLYTKAASLSNKDDVAKLISLVDMLREIQPLIYNANNAANQVKFQFDCFARDITINDCSKGIDQALNKNSVAQGAFKNALTKTNDYINILNGDMGMNLPNLE